MGKKNTEHHRFKKVLLAGRKGIWIWVRCGPLPGTVSNKGLGRDSLLKMWQNPGGHWHPGRGPYPRYGTVLRKVGGPLKLTAKAPENRPGPKTKRSYSNHPFSGAKMLVSGRVHPRKINMIHLKITGWLIGILPMVYYNPIAVGP